jgi:hypothetical protein
VVAAGVFAVAWFRFSLTTAKPILGYFIFYGILIVIFSMILGLPLAALIERLKIGRWWSYLVIAAATGALLGAVVSSHPTAQSGHSARTAKRDEQETNVENPFAITFSPWTRSQPGFAGETPPIQWIDYVGTIAFGAVVGGALGISLCFFDTRNRHHSDRG